MNQRVIMIKGGLRCPDPSCRLSGWRCLKCLLNNAEHSFQDVEDEENLELSVTKVPSIYQAIECCSDQKVLKTLINDKTWVIHKMEGVFQCE